MWYNGTGYSNFFTNQVNTAPDVTGWLYNFETEMHDRESDNGGRRISAYFVSPESGLHRFMSTHDDVVQIWFGVSSSLNEMILQSTVVQNWYVTTVSTSEVNLVAGKKYYLEARLYHVTRLDYVAVGIAFPSGKQIIPITQKYLVAIE